MDNQQTSQMLMKLQFELNAQKQRLDAQEDKLAVQEKQLAVQDKQIVQLKKENTALKEANFELKQQNDSLQKQISGNHIRIAQLAEEYKDLRNKMRDSRFAVNSFAAACKLAKQVVTVLNGVIFAALLSYTIAIGIVLGGVNAAIAALLVGWPPILSPLMAAYWVAMKDINLNEANIENDKHLQQSLDNLLQLKTD